VSQPSSDSIPTSSGIPGPAPIPGQQQQQQQFPPQGFNQPPPGNFLYPPGFLPPPGYNAPPQFNLSQIPPQQFAQLPPHIQQQLLLQQQQQFQQQQQQYQHPPEQGIPQQYPPQGLDPQGHQLPTQTQVQQPQQQVPHQVPQQAPLPPQQQQQQVQQQVQNQKPQQKQLSEQHQAQQHQQQPTPQSQAARVPDLSEFPVLGSEGATHTKHDRSSTQGQQQQHQQAQYENYPQRGQQERNQDRNNQQLHHYHHHHQYGPQHHDNFHELSDEDKQRWIRRQQKVQRILQFTGIMTPRDKDFVTRVQLSQIVTDDPYNEDFYFQVYRLLKTGNHDADNNSIAQAYLDFSGHKLGGRYQRADLALQRMQQQVQKAVTVAKERSKVSAGFSKEGTLGKVSFVSSKMPRKQLQITGQKPELPEISKGGKKAILSQLENIYQQVLTLESNQREGKELDTESLWDSLKLFDNTQQSNQFIQTLSYEKGLKIFPRVFNLLDRQQKLTIVTLLFANLSFIKIISKSSFKSHKDDIIPNDVQKSIELFQLVVLKPIILFLSYHAVFNEVIGLLTILVEHNNISFLSTSKLGISLITTLLSKAELIKQEQTISSEDLSQWSDAYDLLFTTLENKLPLIFPSSRSNFDDSYIWQFLASLAVSGKINHQRIIVDEIRDEIFGSIKKAKESDEQSKSKIIVNLNLFLNVIGLGATEDEIVELK
jgi:DNA topoisomerase 2-associated protein PAT1